MEEILKITKQYDAMYVEEQLHTLEDVNRFAVNFFIDVANLYDCLTRIKNTERNPTGYSLDDAPIISLLVRVWKLMKEVIKYYEQNNAEIISILERPIIESSVIATYLMQNGPDVMEDYRKCSYKDRLRIIREHDRGSAFFESKPGKRLLKSVQVKMDLEGLTPQDFQAQKKNRWRIQGKTFFDIFSEVVPADLYSSTYGIMSESIHCSWNDSMDWCLIKNQDGTFSINPYHHPADIRYVSPILKFTNPPFRFWLQRINSYNEFLRGQLDWVARVNIKLFHKFDEMYDGDI